MNNFTGSEVQKSDDNNQTVCLGGKAHVHQYWYHTSAEINPHGWRVGPCTCGTGPTTTIEGELARAVADFLKDGKTRQFDSNRRGEDGESTDLAKYTEDQIERSLPPEYCAEVDS